MIVVLGINTNDYCPLPQFSHPRTESEYTKDQIHSQYMYQ